VINVNGWSKLAQFLTLLSTFIALSVALYLTLGKEAPFPEQKFTELVQSQGEQELVVAEMKKDIDGKIDTQNKVILEFDKRISKVEDTQTEVLTIMEENEKQRKLNAEAEKKKQEESAEKQNDQTVIDKKEENNAPPKEVVVPKHVYVDSSDGLNLRESPSNSSKKIAVLSNQKKLTVIGGPQAGSNYEWYKIKTAEGLRGWVAIEFTKQ
jgi:uncharacterized protein (DUF1330 family)